MFDRERPELEAFGALESLVRHLGEELASFRRRALTAEARLRDIDAAAEGGPVANQELTALRERVDELERENVVLRDRIEAATTRTRQMLDRVHFLRQQAQSGSERRGDR